MNYARKSFQYLVNLKTELTPQIDTIINNTKRIFKLAFVCSEILFADFFDSFSAFIKESTIWRVLSK